MGWASAMVVGLMVVVIIILVAAWTCTRSCTILNLFKLYQYDELLDTLNNDSNGTSSNSASSAIAAVSEDENGNDFASRTSLDTTFATTTSSEINHTSDDDSYNDEDEYEYSDEDVKALRRGPILTTNVSLHPRTAIEKIPRAESYLRSLSQRRSLDISYTRSREVSLGDLSMRRCYSLSYRNSLLYPREADAEVSSKIGVSKEIFGRRLRQNSCNTDFSYPRTDILSKGLCRRVKQRNSADFFFSRTSVSSTGFCYHFSQWRDTNNIYCHESGISGDTAGGGGLFERLAKRSHFVRHFGGVHGVHGRRGYVHCAEMSESGLSETVWDQIDREVESTRSRTFAERMKRALLQEA